MNETTTTIILLAIVLIALFVIPQLRVRSAISSVIRTFKQANAIDENSAKTPQELGLKMDVPAPSTFGGLGGGDPKQTALKELRDANIIQSTSDGRLFLSEARLAASKWGSK